MNKVFLSLFVTMSVIGCSNNPKDVVDNRLVGNAIADNKISLRTDTINTVKLTDTLVIYEST